MPCHLTTRIMINFLTFYLQVTVFNKTVKAYKIQRLGLHESHTPAPRRPSGVDVPYPEQRTGDGTSPYAEQRLLFHLLRDYDPDARGVADVQDTVRVTIDLLLLRIQSLDERSQVLTTTGLLITDWNDTRLMWSPQDYDNVTDIVLKPHRIWIPELALMNGAIELSPDFRKIRVLVRYDGRVHWEPGGVFMTTCDIDIRYFPFDRQGCVIQFGSWAYYSDRMNISNASMAIQTMDLRKNGEWDVIGTKSEWRENVLPCCPLTRYSYVEFKLYLRRRCTFYVTNIILPCILLSILVLIVFCLPPDGGEKISLGISVLLAFTVFLMMVAENVPRTSLHIPIIVIYLTSTMALGTMSVCLTVFVLNLHHQDGTRPVPAWSRVLVLRYLSKALCVTSRKSSDTSCRRNPDTLSNGLRNIVSDIGLISPGSTRARMHAYNGTIVENGDEPATEMHELMTRARRARHVTTAADHMTDWREMAHVLDRLFFYIVFLLMTAATLAVFCVPAANNAMIDIMDPS